jgi:hypothetical protein
VAAAAQRLEASTLQEGPEDAEEPGGAAPGAADAAAAPLEMDADAAVEYCLLAGLHCVQDAELPMLTSDFYTKHMLACKPPGAPPRPPALTSSAGFAFPLGSMRCGEVTLKAHAMAAKDAASMRGIKVWDAAHCLCLEELGAMVHCAPHQVVLRGPTGASDTSAADQSALEPGACVRCASAVPASGG